MHSLLQNAYRQHARKLRGGLAVILALSVGIFAEGSSREAALREWETRHSPAPGVWQGALGAHGYRGLSASDSLQRISRSLPSRSTVEGDAPNAGWIDPADNWIVVTADPPAAFCARCDIAPSGWQPLPPGWRGFEEALLRSANRPTPPSPGKKQIAWTDPRQIHY